MGDFKGGAVERRVWSRWAPADTIAVTAIPVIEVVGAWGQTRRGRLRIGRCPAQRALATPGRTLWTGTSLR